VKDAARGLSDADIEQLTSYHIQCEQEVRVLTMRLVVPACQTICK
jgi:hypothetical protein